MRTTLSLDDDVLEQARYVAARSSQPFRLVVNEALRAGLRAASVEKKVRPYRTKASPMKLRPGHELDNIQELLAAVEGEAFR